MDLIEEFYESLGVVGIPLLLVALAATFVVVKVYSKLWMLDLQFRRFFQRVESGETRLLFATEPNKNPLICIVRDIVTKHRLHSNDLRAEIEYLFHKHFYSTKHSFTTLRLIAMCAPLLGLLGTVVGIIQVFAAIAEGGNAAADNQALARGIGQALYTTVFGIVIAIPTLIAHYYLRHKLLGYAITVTEFTNRAVAIAEKIDEENAGGKTQK
ncbi:MAG: MotA/TolQ/ExbB proton channel family protein [Opitutae bacterium]|nr:MotA/TolQ/ExbB proton channel family protein [Opitutae bacterium]MCD8298438.1 MotA/TolQ/ExbB proton channel family protein [Opitutae bacterium]